MNKEKKLKLILSSFKEKQLIKFFQTFLDAIKCKFYKSIKQISFSCYQSTCQVQNYMVNGYGKTSSEALISGINNLIDCLIQQQEYCETMRQCLRKFNVSPYGLVNNGSSSKKQLLSTQKALQTVGAQTSMSLQKKVLTMSANLSSNSKDSSCKAKSIKEQIFEYFNLENLKVKNPNQPFSSISPLNAKNKTQTNILGDQRSGVCEASHGAEKQLKKQAQQSNLSQEDKQIQQVYKHIKQVQQKIQAAQRVNKKLKQQINNKKTMNQQYLQTNQNNYFTRPSLQNKQQKKNVISNTQSNKKISYLQMSLNQKIKDHKNQHQKREIVDTNDKNYKFLNEKQNSKHYYQNQVQNKNKIKNEYETKNQNHFQNVQIFKQTQKDIVEKWNPKIMTTTQANNKINEQRRCLVDISNIKTEGQIYSNSSKINDYASFNNNPYHTKTQSKTPTSHNSINIFQTIASKNNERISNPILYSKGGAHQQQSLSIIESSKKLRSFSVQNSLGDKLSTYNASIKNPISTISGGPHLMNNLNSSFQCSNNSRNNSNFIGGAMNIPQKKINIPKLNLEILPNYHGKSNKSLNQSLMENYQKKNHSGIGVINQ